MYKLSLRIGILLLFLAANLMAQQSPAPYQITKHKLILQKQRAFDAFATNSDIHVDMLLLNNRPHLYTRHYHNDSMSVYQFNNQKLQYVRSFALPKSYNKQSEFRDVRSFKVISPDSILIIQSYRISIYNPASGKIIYQHIINRNPNRKYNLVQVNPIEYYSPLQQIICNAQDEQNRPLFALFNPANNGVIPIPFTGVYNKSLQPQGYYDYNYCASNQHITAICSGSPLVEIYDFRKKKLQKINFFKLNNIPDYRSQYDIKSGINIIQRQLFTSLCYNPQQQHYLLTYRQYKAPWDADTLTDKYHSENAFYIFNNNFRLLHQQPLSEKAFIKKSFYLQGTYYAVLSNIPGQAIEILAIKPTSTQ